MEDGRQPQGMSRKTFVDWILGAGTGGLLAAVLYPVVRYLIPPAAEESTANAVTLPFGPDELPRNAGRIFNFGGKPGIVVRTPSGDLRAFSARCTHLDCTVQYREDLGHIWCACHNGHFDLNGNVLSGPPPAPLTAFTVNVRGDQIVVGLQC